MKIPFCLKIILVLTGCLLCSLHAEETTGPLFKLSGPWPGGGGAISPEGGSSINSKGSLIEDRDSIFYVEHAYKILYILDNGEYKETGRLMRINLYHPETGKAVYVSPWSLLANGEEKGGYSVSFNLQKNGLLTIKWDEKVIAEFTEKQLGERNDIYLGTKEINSDIPKIEDKPKEPLPPLQKKG